MFMTATVILSVNCFLSGNVGKNFHPKILLTSMLFQFGKGSEKVGIE